MTTASAAPSAPFQPVSRGLDAVWGLMGLVALLLPLSTTGGTWIGNADLTVLLMIAGILLFALAGLRPRRSGMRGPLVLAG
ncbi:MAG TPA: ABC transporter permease, partial [Tistrella mobilis]|nr:ABC transporter permease [Tistrella mobilis]